MHGTNTGFNLQVNQSNGHAPKSRIGRTYCSGGSRISPGGGGGGGPVRNFWSHPHFCIDHTHSRFENGVFWAVWASTWQEFTLKAKALVSELESEYFCCSCWRWVPLRLGFLSKHTLMPFTTLYWMFVRPYIFDEYMTLYVLWPTHCTTAALMMNTLYTLTTVFRSELQYRQVLCSCTRLHQLWLFIATKACDWDVQ